MEKNIYRKGDIIFITNVVFLDGTRDTRINGHPFLVLEDVKKLGQVVKALKITSRENPNYPQIRLRKGILKKVSYINLSGVYNIAIETETFPYAHIELEEYLRNYKSIVFT